MTLAAATRAAIAAAMRDAAHGERTATADRLAAMYGVSRAAIYRAAQVGGTKRQRAPAKPEYREWVRVAVALARFGPRDTDRKVQRKLPKAVPLDLAIEAAIAGGDLPPEAADMPVATARRLAREMGLTERRKRTHRMHADYPMQALQIDGSGSDHLVAVRELEDGDWLLKLHRGAYSASGYKNKAPKTGVKPWVYSAWDMCTGYVLARYVVAPGENALDAIDFLCWALGADKDPRLVLHGVPDDLWSDQGPLWRAAMARDLLERLDINVADGEPGDKERMGGVERSHRTRWARFERALFLRGSETIRLSELNDRLVEFTVRENGTRLSRTRVGGREASRTAAWVALTNARPADNPLRKLPDNPLQTLTREGPRTLDNNGILEWRNEEYECLEWHNRRVIVRQAIDGSGDLVLEDPGTKERRTARRYQPRPYGEIRGTAATELDKLRGDMPEVSGADLYAPSGGDDPTVVSMPSRSAAAAPLPNPLDASRCRDLDEAMRLFTEIYPHALDAANRALVVERLEADDLRRDAVVELAQRLALLAANEG